MDLFDLSISNLIAKYLLQIKAIKINPTNPFLWSSGWKSPIYCDNRKILSYPDIRTFVAEAMTSCMKKHFPNVEVIAGVATGAIAHGMLVAHKMELPFIYVRHEAKSHGLKNKIEGHLENDKQVVVIEDLISTGENSLNVVKAIREAGANVLGLVAIFSYDFESTKNRFNEEKCQYWSLTNYEALINIALEMNLIEPHQFEILQSWRNSPHTWGQNL